MPLNLDPRVLAALQGQANQDPRKALEKEILQRYLQKLQSDRADPQQIAMQRQDQMGKEDLSILGSASRGFDEAASKMGGTRPSASIAKQAGELRQDAQSVAKPAPAMKGVDTSVLNYLAKKNKPPAPPKRVEVFDEETGQKWSRALGPDGKPQIEGQFLVGSEKYKRDKDELERGQDMAWKYSKEDPYVKGSRAIRDKYVEARNLMSRPPTGPQDIALIIGFMKTLDPGSVVREGEFKTAAEAGGLFERLKAAKDKVLGTGLVSDETRKEIVDAMKTVWESRKKAQLQYDQGFSTDFGYTPRSEQWEVDESESQQQTAEWPKTVVNPETNETAQVADQEQLSDAQAEGWKVK